MLASRTRDHGGNKVGRGALLRGRFRDRSEAGRELARLLAEFRGRNDVVVLALPRGGLPVAFEVARSLGAPLDVFIVRKLGVPGHEELAMGAIATGGVRFLNEDVLHQIAISESEIAAVATQEQRELERRERLYRGGAPALDVRGRIVIVVDDGLATGSTMRAAVIALRQLGPAMVIVAVPVAAASTCREFQAIADDIVCARTPEPFYAVGMWYEDFSQTSDEEVREFLQRAASFRTTDSPSEAETTEEER